MVLDLKDEKVLELLNKINKDMDEVMKIIDETEDEDMEEVFGEDYDTYQSIINAIKGT